MRPFIFKTQQQNNKQNKKMDKNTKNTKILMYTFSEKCKTIRIIVVYIPIQTTVYFYL